MAWNRYIGVTLRRLVTLLAVALAVSVTVPFLASATSNGRGFITQDTNLKTGMAASLSANSTSSKQYVEIATRQNYDRFVGIVSTKQANSVTVSSSDSNIYVTTSGAAQALVSDVNGSIKKNDRLTLSSINGIVMKANNNELAIIGSAQEDFSDSKAQPQTVTGNNGSQQTTKVELLSIEVDPHTSVAEPEKQKPFLVLIGESITGKTVNKWQVLSALILLFLTLMIVGSVIYGAVHSSITAIGRNPLASQAVYKQVLQVSVVIIVILLFASASIYAILWF